MKRLNLEDFKAKNSSAVNEEKTDLLLGQVLGDCHDGSGDEGNHGPAYYAGYYGAKLIDAIFN